MKKRLCVLLAALGGSVLLLGACSSVVDRFSRPESVTETSTEAELRASGSNASSAAAEESSEESGAAESEFRGKQR